MKRLTKEQAKLIGDLTLDLSVAQSAVNSEIAKGPMNYSNDLVHFWMNKHDTSLQALRNMGVTKENGPSKYKE